ATSVPIRASTTRSTPPQFDGRPLRAREVAVPRADRDRPARREVAHENLALRDAGQRAVTAVLDEPPRPADRRSAGAADRPGVALAAPPDPAESLLVALLARTRRARVAGLRARPFDDQLGRQRRRADLLVPAQLHERLLALDLEDARVELGRLRL